MPEPEKKIPAYTLLLAISILPLAMGSWMLICQAQAKTLFKESNIDPLFIGIFLVGAGFMDIAFAAFLKSKEQ